MKRGLRRQWKPAFGEVGKRCPAAICWADDGGGGSESGEHSDTEMKAENRPEITL